MNKLEKPSVIQDMETSGRLSQLHQVRNLGWVYLYERRWWAWQAGNIYPWGPYLSSGSAKSALNKREG